MKPTITIGLVINPVAGMGGRVGLKGTDGKVEQARQLGAESVSNNRARIFFEHLGIKKCKGVSWLTSAGNMGETLLESMMLDHEILYTPGHPTSSIDTKNVCEMMLERSCDLIIFCGGDGTARDIFSIIGTNIPILGIPSGVKMLSGVFAINPSMAAELVGLFCKGVAKTKDAEIVDLDEEKYRRDIFAFKLFGIAKTIFEGNFIQSSKMLVTGPDEDEVKHDIARTVIEDMNEKTLYLLGAGTTVKAISDGLGIEKTTLGIDAVKDKTLISKDLNENDILKLLDKENDVKVIVSPIGAQGFVFGRGNLQLSPRVIRSIGIENIIVVSSQAKLKTIAHLLVDTGDETLDYEFTKKRYLPVIIGYRTTTIKNLGIQKF